MEVEAARGCAALSSGTYRPEEDGGNGEVEICIRHDDGCYIETVSLYVQEDLAGRRGTIVASKLKQNLAKACLDDLADLTTDVLASRERNCGE